MKKICLISGGLEGGGMERALTNFANYCAEHGYKVYVVNLFKTEQFFSLHPNIEIIWPTLDRSKLHRMIYALALLPYLRRQIREIKPDVVLSYGEWFNGYVLLATLFLGVPVFVSDRMGPNLHLGWILETARKVLYRFASGIIAQTQVASTILAKKTGAKLIAVISNPVLVIDTDTSHRKKQIVTVGRLSREKGHILLLEAFAQLDAPSWTLHFVGDGKERVNLEAATSRLDLTNRVVFHGHLKDFKDILGYSEIFALPSYYEGFPNALLEAMSVPLACVSTDCVAGPKEIIEHEKNGLLVPVGDVTALANALQKLVDEDALRQSIQTNAYAVRETFDFEVLAKRYLDFILKDQAQNTINKH